MISTQHRFHGHNSLNYVYRSGQTVRGPLCSVRFTLNNRRDTYRMAVVVSKKVSKSAVVRNRIRRRLYETVRRHETELSGVYDIVFTVFSETLAELPAAEVERTVVAQLRQAGILKSKRAMIEQTR